MSRKLSENRPWIANPMQLETTRFLPYQWAQPLLVLGWGSTEGAIHAAVNLARKQGAKVSRAHLHHLNPFPKNLGDILGRFEKVLVPEMNLGQLALLLRARYLKDIVSYNKVEGKPFYRFEVLAKIQEVLAS